jgi:hypothetical protein
MQKFSRREFGIGASALAIWAASALSSQGKVGTGYSWHQLPFGAAGYVSGFAYHPRARDILYARTDIGGAYRYDYLTSTWMPLLDSYGRDDSDFMGVLSIGLDVQNPQRVFLACGLYLEDWARKGAILRSDDQGKTWQKTELPIRVGGNTEGRGSGERLQVDPWVGDVVLYGSNRDGLWISHDAARTFTALPGRVKSVSLVAFDPFSGTANRRCSKLYIGSCEDGGGLYCSEDEGASFDRVAGTPNLVPQHLVFDGRGNLYVTFAGSRGTDVVNPNNATLGAVWRWQRATGTWTDITPSVPTQSSGFGYSGIDVGANGALIVSTIDRWAAGDDLFVSFDQGNTWKSVGAQATHAHEGYYWLDDYLRKANPMGHWTSDVKINPFDSDELIYGTGYGIWRTQNLSDIAAGTVAFRYDSKGFEETATLPSQLWVPVTGKPMAAFGDVGGAVWDDVDKIPQSRLFRPSNQTNVSCDFAGLRPNLLVRTSLHFDNGGYTSSDLGLSWQPFSSSPIAAEVTRGGKGDPGVVAISADGQHLVWAPEKSGLYWSEDKGKTWITSVGVKAATEGYYRPVSDKVSPSTFYVFDRTVGALMKSDDGGQSFTTALSNLPKLETWQSFDLRVDRTRAHSLWLALPSGLFYLDSKLGSWKRLDTVDEAWLVADGAPRRSGAPATVFLWGRVNGHEGIWRSEDACLNWTRINDDTHQFGSLRAIAGDPTTFGTIYIAPHGRGLVVGRTF